MILRYFPPFRIEIDNIDVHFNQERINVREKLNRIFEQDNQTIYLGRDNTEPLYIKRDIYKGESAAETFYFLDYDTNDLLTEVEVHQCERIDVLGFSFSFEDELDEIALKLITHSEIIIKSEGEIYFKDLNMCICDRRKMGGEGNTLAYFYCASDTTHLD